MIPNSLIFLTVSSAWQTSCWVSDYLSQRSLSEIIQYILTTIPLELKYFWRYEFT